MQKVPDGGRWVSQPLFLPALSLGLTRRFPSPDSSSPKCSPPRGPFLYLVCCLSGPSPQPRLRGDAPSGRAGPRPARPHPPVPRGDPSGQPLANRSPQCGSSSSDPPRSHSFHSFIFPLQGWTLPGARWLVAEAVPEGGPLQPPPRGMESLSAAREEGERRGRGAPFFLAPAPEEPRPLRLQVAVTARPRGR